MDRSHHDWIRSNQPELKKEEIVVNQEAPKMTGYKTYVLFGIDSRGEGSKFSAQNSDTMIIVSVNNDTKEVKMASVYRDTLLNIGNDTYTKANAAYAYGGPEQAITMLNTNLDLDISDYATADFSALVEVVDDLGGLEIPVILCRNRAYEQLLCRDFRTDWKELHTDRETRSGSGRSGGNS